MILSNDGTVLIKVLDSDIENGTFAIPNSVTRIGNDAFRDCSSLSDIHLPGGLTHIGAGAFDGCSSLSEIHLPEGITQIGYCAFSGCSSLSEIHLPEGITQIGAGAFKGCSSLREIHLPEGITHIGDYAFSGCSSLSDIHLPEGLTQIGDWYFFGCSSLREIHLPEGITQIGYLAFYGCSSLREIHLPEGITQIGDEAFYGCSSLREIHLPEGINQIGSWVFYGCSSLSDIHLPEGITQIGDYAFPHCSSLKEIHLPEGITHIGDYAFSGCSSLSEIHLPEGITQIGYCAFSGCSSLKEIHLPEGITQIGDYAFPCCSSLKEIHLPEGLTHIGVGAFYGCSSLKEIHLPEGITQIGNEAFYGCQSLADIVINSDDEKEIARIKSLLPWYLHQHMVSKAYYDKAQQKIESLLARPEFNPLYPFMVNESLSLFPDALTVIGGFQRESSQSYQSAKEDMENIPIPENEAQIQAYQEKLDDIAERYLNEAKNEARKQVEHQYQESIKLYPEQIKNFSSTDIKKTREKYPLLSEEESGKYLDAFNRFHQCCAELSKKHSDFVTRDEKAATRGTHELLNTLQLAYMDYMKDAREIEEKSKLSERAKAFRQTCQEAIDKATPELEKHRGVKKILTNLAIALVTLGTAFVVNYALTGRFFFHPATASEKILNKASKAIEEIDIPALKQEPKKGT
ncbi:leucine-rich repeat protein [Legionella sp. 27cVA30]|uniref:leucine-rich repeat domain-containing protein n=1 Tax=Legionella sp. 27cVA30 TaxID=2905657 RepID=UPI00209C7F00|nr:leucine-rich repeat protein [Legionella sp. 27cVA30]MCP0913280.1 leucine-rich repeat protein [Legionella sp. 27cVA30]